MRKELDGFLWRSCNRATLDTLLGVSSGQYHIALPKRDFSPFFRGLSAQNPTERGGFEFMVPIQPFSGSNPVEQRTIVVRYLGLESERKDWNIRAQRPDSAYELWRENRGFVSRQSVGDNDFIVIARDTDNGFHGRWIRSADFNALPEEMRKPMINSEAGWQAL
jgi:hypothetical protein